MRRSELRDTPAAGALRDAFRRSAAADIERESSIREILGLLRAADVYAILIKGWANARLYPNAALRFHGDLDLIVPPEDHPAALRALEDRSPAGPPVDIWHEELDRVDAPGLRSVFERARAVGLAGTEVCILAPEDHLALLCVHFLRHGGWHPVWLCDIAVVLETRPAGFDWALCLRGPWGREEWILAALALAHRLLGADLAGTPAESTPERLPRWLVQEVWRQWERPSPRQHDPPPLFHTVLRRPGALPGALRARWSNPIQATIRMNGRFGGVPPLLYQVGDYSLHLARYLGARAR